MIVTQLIGGLGNQIFQYAAGLAVAQARGVPLRFDATDFDRYVLRPYALDRLQVACQVATADELARFRPKRTFVARALRKLGLESRLTGQALVYREKKEFSFDPGLLQVPAPAYLIGYWQAWGYAAQVEERLRQELKLRVPFSGPAQELERALRSEESVAIHVRRGDYVSNQQTQSVHGNLTPEYYARAFAKVLERRPGARAVVFSDDLAWCRANLKLPGAAPPRFADAAALDRPEEDLFLMAACRHHILANSSFSWWAAWLGKNPGQIAIAPRRWMASAQVATTELTPPEWERFE